MDTCEKTTSPSRVQGLFSKQGLGPLRSRQGLSKPSPLGAHQGFLDPPPPHPPPPLVLSAGRLSEVLLRQQGEGGEEALGPTAHGLEALLQLRAGRREGRQAGTEWA